MTASLPEPVELRAPSRVGRGLLDVALSPPDGWQRGLTVPWYSCGEPILRNKCIAGEDEAHRPNVVTYPSFPIEQGSTCSTLSGLDHTAHARQRFEDTAEWALGRQLATDQVGTGAPSLNDAEVAGPYEDVVSAIACLEQCAADSGFGSQWVLHTSVRGAAFARRFKMMDAEGFSPSGMPWVVSPGYPSEGATADTVRFWATGPVWAAAGDAEVNAAVDWRQNEDTAYALGTGIVAFDPCILCAVDVTVGECLPPQPPVPTITFPEDGATVNPLAPVHGRGCGPDEEVQLWVNEDAVNNPGAAGRQIDTTMTNENGAFTFVGTTPIAEGTHEFWVVCGGQASDRITVVVEEDVPTETLSFNWELQSNYENGGTCEMTLQITGGLGSTVPAGTYSFEVTGFDGAATPADKVLDSDMTGSSGVVFANLGVRVALNSEGSLRTVGPYGIDFTASGSSGDPEMGQFNTIDSGTVTYTRPVNTTT